MKWSDNLIYKRIPYYVLEGLEKYFRVELEGLENLPARGPAVLVPNHSGFLGFDALILSHVVYKARARVPRIVLHKLWYSKGFLETHARKFGFLKASFRGGLQALRRKQYLIIFPEGERGNFKPSTEMYRLQNFKPGFARMAALTGAPIVPVVIIGAEESNLTLGQFHIRDVVLPIPFNVFPFPAKWKIRFLPPIHLEASSISNGTGDEENEIASRLRERMQEVISEELSARRGIFFPEAHPQSRRSMRHSRVSRRLRPIQLRHRKRKKQLRSRASRDLLRRPR